MNTFLVQTGIVNEADQLNTAQANLPEKGKGAAVGATAPFYLT
ncbi:hypothetical protein NST62_00440 [Ureibacillus sp. FSL K6-8385]|nr:hypothetical protein [Ureibacillus terrenus]MED3661132.1 hypothetical protein [Ureibacillus terrenus]